MPTLPPQATPEEVTPADLVRAARQGEPAAIRLLWRTHTPRVHGLLRRMLGPRGEIEDLAQEVFVRLFERLDRLYEPSSLGSFVLGITVLVAKEELTRRMARRWLMLSPTGDLEDAPDAGVDAEGREALRRFYGLLDRLTPGLRTQFVLRHIEGMELTELAAATETSLATLKRRLAKAEAKLTGWMSADPVLALYLQQGDAPWVRRGGES